MSGESIAIVSRPREQEASIVLVQNNHKRTVKIVEISDEAAQLLGYARQELEGLPLQTILSDASAESLEEMLEYADDADDLDSVVKRIYAFSLKRFGGEELPVAVRVMRIPSCDQHHWFQAIVKDERRQIKETSLATSVSEQFAGMCALDEASGLPDHYSCQRYLESLQNYAQSHGLASCFAILRIDRHEKNLARYGKAGCIQLLRHAAACCKSTFRLEDVVCYLAEDKIALFLLDIDIEAARVVLNRLRWNIRNHRIEFGGKGDFSVTVSIVFAPIGSRTTSNLLESCENRASAIDADERNLLIELGGE